jgi:glyoxylase-like metal-dependent hydrolase (beta-lactamase superfamily II)
MQNFVCRTCGTQFPASDVPPEHCPICEDERQYIGPDGQQWTTLEELRASHHNELREQEPGLTGIGTEPKIAIGQRALLIQTPQGNILWDCITLIDNATVEAVHKLGGISAIAISHPHYYSSMVEWGHAFDAPIYLHTADREHVMRPDPRVYFWDGDTHSLADSITLIHTGGHYAGSLVLHWAAGAGGRGVLMTGDTVHVVQDTRYVTFMYSYPNMIPLPRRSVEHITAALEPYPYDRLYGAWWEKVILSGAKQAVAYSAERYIKAIEDTLWT